MVQQLKFYVNQYACTAMVPIPIIISGLTIRRFPAYDTCLYGSSNKSDVIDLFSVLHIYVNICEYS